MDSSAAIRLDMNENPFGPSPMATEAVIKNINTISLYKDMRGDILKQAIADHCHIIPEQITVNNYSGSAGLLLYFTQAFAEQGDEIIFSREGFTNLLFTLLRVNETYKTVVIPTYRWKHDLDAMIRAVTPKTRLIYIVNPDNPAGTWIRHGELNGFLSQIPENIRVVVDEAYYEYAVCLTGGEYPDSMELQKKFPNLIITRTFSKAYGLAGLRIGYSVSDTTTAEYLNKDRLLFGITVPALAAAPAALKDRDHLKRTLENNKDGMEYIQNSLSGMNIDYIPSKAANFVTFDLGENAGTVRRKLMERSIAVADLAAGYHMPGKLRVTVGLPEQNIAFTENLGDILSRIKE